MKLHILFSSVLLLSINKNCTPPVAADSADTTVQSNENSDIKTASALENTVRFGVMVARTEGKLIPPDKQVQVAKALGVNYVRARIDIKGWNGNSDAYDTYAAAGLKVLLNINSGIPRNAAGEHDPIPFPTDMGAYRKSLNSILDKYKPEVVVIENEEDNPGYHSGTAEDYINELKTGIEVAHSKGLKVTNGGITVREICLIVYDDYVQRGEKEKAMEFAKKAFPPAFMQRLNNMENNSHFARQVEFGRKIIAAYKTLDLDYVNFHWYEPVRARGKNVDASVNFDPKVFAFVVDFLKTRTGKPVLTNEFGVLDPSPELVKDLLKAVKDSQLGYAIFYSSDGGEGKAIALQNAGGDLRENGMAFRDFVKQQLN